MLRDDVRKKVLMDIFASPSTLLPVVGGATVGMLSWAMDAYFISYLGGAAVVTGVGVFLSRLLFNLEGVTEQAFVYMQEKKASEIEDDLDALHKRLSENDDPDDQDYLKELRDSYKNHKEQVTKGKVVSNAALEEKLAKLFAGCVEQLKYSEELADSMKTFKRGSEAKKDLQQKRGTVLKEVKEAIKYFHRTINEIQGISTERSVKSLADLRNEVQSSVDVVKRTEERLTSEFE